MGFFSKPDDAPHTTNTPLTKERIAAFLTRQETIFSVRRQRIGRSLPSCSRSVQHDYSTPHRERRRRWQELHW